jgi:hypothetical protein
MRFVLVAIPLASWTRIALLARDIYGAMAGASAWLMTSACDWPHVLPGGTPEDGCGPFEIRLTLSSR